MGIFDDRWVCEDDSYLDGEIWGEVITLPNVCHYTPMVRRNTLEEAAADYDTVVVFSGSRTIWCAQTIYRTLDSCMRPLDKASTLIVIGGAQGVDGICLEWARENGWHYWIEEADWTGLGRRAGMVRNHKMAMVATHIGIFWDGHSPGSKGMMNLCEHLVAERGISYFMLVMPITWREYDAACKSNEDPELHLGVD